jgi:hypothetical protein
MLGQVSVAAASAVLGADLAANTYWQQSNRPRNIVAIGLKGSAAALDTKVRVLVGANQVGEVFNSGTGAPNRDDLFRLAAFVPSGEEVHVFVDDAAASNPINLTVDFQEL